MSSRFSFRGGDRIAFYVVRLAQTLYLPKRHTGSLASVATEDGRFILPMNRKLSFQ